MSRGPDPGDVQTKQFALGWSLLTSDRSVSGTHGRGCSSGWRERPEVASTSARIPRLARSLPFRRGWAPSARVVVKERCESGRIGLTANELTWETGSQGSNPCLSAEANRQAKRAIAVGCGSPAAGTIQHCLPDVNNFGWCPPLVDPSSWPPSRPDGVLRRACRPLHVIDSCLRPVVQLMDEGGGSPPRDSTPRHEFVSPGLRTWRTGSRPGPHGARCHTPFGIHEVIRAARPGSELLTSSGWLP